MRNTLALFGALTITFFAVGWYLGWYQFHTTSTAKGQPSVTFDFNTKKIGEDLGKAKDQLQQRIAEKIKASQEARKLRQQKKEAEKVEEKRTSTEKENPFKIDVDR